METIFMTLLLLYQLLGGDGSGAQTASVQKLVQTAYASATTGTEVAGPGGQDANTSETTSPSQPSKTGNFIKQDPQPDAPPVKGVYVTAHSAGGSRMETLLQLLDDTDLNAMVIDVKDDYGYITYPTQNPELLKFGKPQKYIRDMDALMSKLEAHDVYPIARVVVFKDTVLAGSYPELSFTKQDGTVWQNGKKDSFVNPYMKEVWDYNIAVAKEAVKLGFKEIQFDYVRFPEGFEKKAADLRFHQTGESRVDTVAGFVKYAKEQLEPLGVRVSVDIFGYAASVPAAEGIGQDFVKISKQVDVISPMIYPSHYSTGWFGVKEPDMSPYATIKGAIADTHKKLDPIGSFKPVIRPWIQDFTASWLGKGHYIKYGKPQVEAQIKALHDSGVDEYLLWNAGNKYTPGVIY
ncbi:hypothetical protein FHS18_000257 [Paenibacillus phyllosphaerae]|uniref:DUF4015 domain-containing protein n=1 Tax=Paenibacillus phyllosphaerae TaxID=274593 RepID=A0A7W5AT17_9BACL|nr:putative glycoside hydrolase [Paenibacillus phyllosphaerae]MBB3108229.1 hypothetical protein [Paenibacillus phyllosphaerae]